MFIERMWRTIKYERVYLQAYDSVSKARKDIAQYIDWYNNERGHSRLRENPQRSFIKMVCQP
ncbi:MAG: integrase core domain-containing protein [Limnobacter sp.]|uniref:integrase core domain-containing protein n=1 Tax=Limnobacter sp. TaxID=2003368 RepID=UPI0040379815